MDDLDRFLRDARPPPRAEFVRELEDRLFPPARPRGARCLSVLLAGGAAAVALAAIGLLLAVAGLMPLGLNGDRPAGASSQCKTVFVNRPERRAFFVIGRDGKPQLKYRTRLVPRLERRCR